MERFYRASALPSAVIAMILSVYTSVRLSQCSIISTKENRSKPLVFGDVKKLLKLEGYHPQRDNYRYPHYDSGIQKAQENECAHCVSETARDSARVTM